MIPAWCGVNPTTFLRSSYKDLGYHLGPAAMTRANADTFCADRNATVAQPDNVSNVRVIAEVL